MISSNKSQRMNKGNNNYKGNRKEKHYVRQPRNEPYISRSDASNNSNNHWTHDLHDRPERIEGGDAAVLVSNLHWDVSEGDIQSLFEYFGIFVH